jgi:hypothetical protein
LAVKLKLSGDDRVLTPAVEVKSGLSKNECSGIRYIGSTSGGKTSEGVGSVGISGTGGLKDTTRDEGIGARKLIRGTEGMDGVRKSINGISVVEWLSTKSLV